MMNFAKKLIKDLGVDTRLLGMIGALLLVWLLFQYVTDNPQIEGTPPWWNIYAKLIDGNFLSPRNLFNLSVQTASVAVMATGMVFVIVTRHIDLSVGSMLGLIGMIMGTLQLHILPQYLGLGHPAIWVITVAAGLGVGIAIGAFQGWLVGYLTIPAFIVTLGGYLIWRGAAWWVTSGQTVSPLDPVFKLLGGGAEGTLGANLSWLLGVVASLAALLMLYTSRRNKAAHGFTVKPVWAELALGGIVMLLIMGFAALMVAYPIPERAAIRIAEARGMEIPAEGISLAHGIAIPVVIVLAVAIVMTFIAKRTRFGRYIYATGGNPDAAELSGINTRWLTVKIFALMGALTAIASVIASARLGAVGNDLGTLDELRVIAAAVIGGTALSGGIGTIYGAIIGALIMQSLQSGMAMVGVDAPLQSIVVGAVLVEAVLIDIASRNHAIRPATILFHLIMAALLITFFVSWTWGLLVTVLALAVTYFWRIIWPRSALVLAILAIVQIAIGLLFQNGGA